MKKIISTKYLKLLLNTVGTAQWEDEMTPQETLIKTKDQLGSTGV